MNKVYITTWGDGLHADTVIAAHQNYDDAVNDLLVSLQPIADSYWGRLPIYAHHITNNCWRCTSGTAFIIEMSVK